MSDNPPTYPERIESLGITMTSEIADANPNMDDMPQGSTHWRCTLALDGRTMTIAYSMGPAHSGEPDLPSVLSCLASDSGGVENASDFDDWCATYGYDTDSRRAERTYKTCVEQQADLKQLLAAHYDAVVFETEPY